MKRLWCIGIAKSNRNIITAYNRLKTSEIVFHILKQMLPLKRHLFSLIWKANTYQRNNIYRTMLAKHIEEIRRHEKWYEVIYLEMRWESFTVELYHLTFVRLNSDETAGFKISSLYTNIHACLTSLIPYERKSHKGGRRRLQSKKVHVISSIYRIRMARIDNKSFKDSQKRRMKNFKNELRLFFYEKRAFCTQRIYFSRENGLEKRRKINTFAKQSNNF